MGIKSIIIFFAILTLEPFFLSLYEGNKAPYSGVVFLSEMSRVDLNTERVLSVLSNKLKVEGYSGIRFACLMEGTICFFLLSFIFKFEPIKRISRNALTVKVHKSEFENSENGSLKKAIDKVKRLSVNGERLVLNAEKKGEYYIFYMSIWGYIRLRFSNIIEKPFNLSKNAHKVQILLPKLGMQITVAVSEFRTIFSLKDTEYNKSAGIKRILENVKKDYQKEGLGRSFEYRLEGGNVVLSTIK